MSSRQAEYTESYRQREAAKRSSGELPPDTCTTPGCRNKRDGPYKRCRSCLDKANAFKKKYRSVPKPEGSCSVQDCQNLVEGDYKMCSSCRARFREAQRNNPEYNKKHQERAASVKALVFDHYGRRCVCCGEEHEEFLTIDHIRGDGAQHLTKSGKTRRRGASLYAWLLRNDFPEGFRVLCHTCNFTLGHFGHCPHSDLTQPTDRLGRPPKMKKGETPEQREARLALNKKKQLELKLEVFGAYGGCKCACCGEDNHECLSIDHINQDGADHREEITGDRRDSRNLYHWLKKNNYPPGFRVLCHNCNWAYGHLGYCPHDSP